MQITDPGGAATQAAAPHPKGPVPPGGCQSLATPGSPSNTARPTNAIAPPRQKGRRPPTIDRKAVRGRRGETARPRARRRRQSAQGKYDTPEKRDRRWNVASTGADKKDAN